MPPVERDTLEAILIEYAERYGLTSAARQYFTKMQAEIPVTLECKPSNPQEKLWVEKLH